VADPRRLSDGTKIPWSPEIVFCKPSTLMNDQCDRVPHFETRASTTARSCLEPQVLGLAIRATRTGEQHV